MICSACRNQEVYLINRGDKVRLIKPYKDLEFGFEYQIGQTGIVASPSYGGDDTPLIDWDGYAEEREADRRQREKYGEGFNVVSFCNIVPREFLEVI